LRLWITICCIASSFLKEIVIFICVSSPIPRVRYQIVRLMEGLTWSTFWLVNDYFFWQNSEWLITLVKFVYLNKAC
jgi:hypothetical protein